MPVNSFDCDGFALVPRVSCSVGRGGVLLMRPLALHASAKASGTSRRRVLHFVFGPPALPYGLEWERGVALIAGRRPA